MSHSSLNIIRAEHASLSAMLQSLRLLIDKGPGKHRQRWFEVVRAILFYIDEVPERQHHPKESALLFPQLLEKAPQCADIIKRLDHDHVESEKGIRNLQHKLVAWEMLGGGHGEAFNGAARAYLQAYFEHMNLEEREILPLAQTCLDEAAWIALDDAFARNNDPFAPGRTPDPAYEALFTRIVQLAPAPIGLAHWD